MNTYTIVPVQECASMLFIGNNRCEQLVTTGLDQKPDGNGWHNPPMVDYDLAGQAISLVWKRTVRRQKAVAPEGGGQ